jgi:hypothetical protein
VAIHFPSGDRRQRRSRDEAVDKALAGAARVVKRTVDATTDEIASELQEALKASDRRRLILSGKA